MGCIEYPAEEHRRIYKFQFGIFLHCPTAHPQQSAQSGGIELLDFRNIQHENAYAFQLLNPATQLVERGPTHHAP